MAERAVGHAHVGDVGHVRPVRRLRLEPAFHEVGPAARALRRSGGDGRPAAAHAADSRFPHDVHHLVACFASIFLKQFLHCFSAAWAAGFQRKLHHMTAQTKTGTSPPCLYIPETQPKNESAGCNRRRSGRKGRWRYRCPNSKISGDWTVRECPGRRSRGGRTWTAPLSRNTPTWTT